MSYESEYRERTDFLQRKLKENPVTKVVKRIISTTFNRFTLRPCRHCSRKTVVAFGTEVAQACYSCSMTADYIELEGGGYIARKNQ